MKKRTNKKVFAGLIAVALLMLSSCNPDATEGNFYQISKSQPPATIEYKALLGIDSDTNTLYFWTTDEIAKYGSGSEISLAGSSVSQLIQSAAYDSTTKKVYYKTNDKEVNSNTFKIIGEEDGTLTSTISADRTKIKNIYGNGIFEVLAQNGEDETTATTVGYELLKYSSTPTSVAIFDSAHNEITSSYGPVAVYQQTTQENEDISLAPIIYSFVDADGGVNKESYYRNFLITFDGSSYSIQELPTHEEKIANFFYDGTGLYILTVDGILYYWNVSDTTFSELYDTNYTYTANCFLYAIEDTGKLYLITKPASRVLYTFTVDTSAATPTTSSPKAIAKGYGEKITSSMDIVGALDISETPSTTSRKLLIATRKNAMFGLTVTVSHAGENSDDNGRITYTGVRNLR